MENHDIQELFRAKSARADSENIDWEAKKKRWLDALEHLYETITEKYLKGALAEKLVSVSRDKKTITEQFIGRYEAPELVLQVGDERVLFSPKGTNIVGATGRVDLIGEMGEKTLVLQPEERWGIVATRTPTLKVVPFDEKSLLAALEEIMRQ